MEEQLLAIDVGTQSTRALIFDLQGNLLFKTQVPLPIYSAANHGWAELEPEKFWESLCEACQKLWIMDGVDKSKIAGVAITCQRNVMINLDKNGKPLRPAIHWSDQRRTTGLPKVGGLWGLGFALAGMTETVRYLQTEAKINWVRTNQPEIWDETYKVVLLSGYLSYQMTGKFIDSTGNQVAYLPFDYKNINGRENDWKWKAVPVEPEKLVDLVQPASFLGEVNRRAAEDTGIPLGLPLIAAAADKAWKFWAQGHSHQTSAVFLMARRQPLIPPTNDTLKSFRSFRPILPPFRARIHLKFNYSEATGWFHGSCANSEQTKNVWQKSTEFPRNICLTTWSAKSRLVPWD